MKNLLMPRRVLLCALIVLAMCQPVALAQNGGQNHAAKIQEVLALAHK
jgi:hypothetical protein